ncbi:Zinc finger protein 263 [Caenorhabditis elegans]|uniref:Zinc finger protein 263 n=1 Tax=Caenorhabditis elegans TaxID=6239 RepID=Q4R177_CAEEL|nr:Zinc finger protein 263 [Caenorhabditis elegans]CCD63925.1 Zinc finger protein 263 [Caenorhabditis elegans]|eukprot:NP_001033360.1 Uncharacterized protein CELE_F27B3.8 [Caenorhabditis elegans]
MQQGTLELQEHREKLVLLTEDPWQDGAPGQPGGDEQSEAFPEAPSESGPPKSPSPSESS